MIQEELRNFIEQNCSGKEPSDLIMEAIGKKIELYGADADEVLAYVEECAKGPTLEQKETEKNRKEKEYLQLVDGIYSAVNSVKASKDKDSFMRAKAECESLLSKANFIYSDNPKNQKLRFELDEEIRLAEKRFKTSVIERMMSAFLLLLMVIFVCFTYFIPLCFKSVRKFMGSYWSKVIGKD
jgi:hypothetical protein